jgi:hypothetical protein
LYASIYLAVWPDSVSERNQQKDLPGMGWANFAMERLQKGETVQIRPSGHSMTGRVNHKDLVTLAPCDPDELAVGDIVLVTRETSICT